MPKQPTFIIIDGNALVHRAFHGIPPLTTKDGKMVNAVYGFVTILLRVIKDFQPDYMAVTFDLPGPTFRHEVYKEYKAQRKKQPDELYAQFPLVKQVVTAFNIPIFEKKGFEADDLIGTLTARAPKHVKTVVVTGDLDTLQLVDEHTFVYTFKRSLNDTVVYDDAAVKERFGLTPAQMIDYKTLRGDSSDNIPGVPGIGEKTASELLQKYETVLKLEKAAEDVVKKKTKVKKGDVLSERNAQKIVEHAKTIIDTRHLVTIVRDVPFDFDLEKAKLVPADSDVVVKLFHELEFKSLLARMMKEGRIREKVVTVSKQGELFGEKEMPNEQIRMTNKNPISNVQLESAHSTLIRHSGLGIDHSQQKYHLVTSEKYLEKLLSVLVKQALVAVDTETTGIDAMQCQLLGISMAWKKDEAYYIPMMLKGADAWSLQKESPCWQQLADLLADEKINKTGHNIKYDAKVLARHGLPLTGITFDSMIAAYLLNPGTRAHNLDSVVFAEFGYQMQPLEDLIGPKGKNQKKVEEVPLPDLAWYSAEDADFSYRLVAPLRKQLEEKVLLPVMDRIEIPLLPVLTQMEMDGAKIDIAFLAKLQKTLAKQIITLDKQIQDKAGMNFNVNSPVQLKEVLFDKLGLSTEGISKIKTGFSTAAGELEKLHDAHPIIPLIEEYREVAKLQSTYVESLPLLVNSHTGRIHTTYSQTIAATGRLSSIDPNLQNIPIRTELGREIRKAFVAADGYTLLSIDYSQIELRVVASLANDEKMLEAFRRGEDIHRRTAADIRGIALEEVGQDQRRAAKEVNFGVLYGMGPFGLAARSGISFAEASEFIRGYFAARPRVKQYLDETVALAREMGFVETLFGRRRYIPDILSGVPAVRAAAERTALNMPIQGTAADLLKLAMIQVGEFLRQEYGWGERKNPDVRMILTVHDELVFEVKKGMERQVAKRISDIMEGVEKLRVPIVVDAKVGENWGEMRGIDT